MRRRRAPDRARPAHFLARDSDRPLTSRCPTSGSAGDRRADPGAGPSLPGGAVLFWRATLSRASGSSSPSCSSPGALLPPNEALSRFITVTAQLIARIAGMGTPQAVAGLGRAAAAREAGSPANVFGRILVGSVAALSRLPGLRGDSGCSTIVAPSGVGSVELRSARLRSARRRAERGRIRVPAWLQQVSTADDHPDDGSMVVCGPARRSSTQGPGSPSRVPHSSGSSRWVRAPCCSQSSLPSRRRVRATRRSSARRDLFALVCARGSAASATSSTSVPTRCSWGSSRRGLARGLRGRCQRCRSASCTYPLRSAWLSSPRLRGAMRPVASSARLLVFRISRRLVTLPPSCSPPSSGRRFCQPSSARRTTIPLSRSSGSSPAPLASSRSPLLSNALLGSRARQDWFTASLIARSSSGSRLDLALIPRYEATGAAVAATTAFIVGGTVAFIAYRARSGSRGACAHPSAGRSSPSWAACRRGSCGRRRR